MDHAAIDRRNQLAIENKGLVAAIANEYRRSGMDIEDIKQEGYIGLLRAAELFDESRGFKFSTYAHWWIRCFIQRAIVLSSHIYVPFHADEIRRKVHKYRKEEERRTGRMPTIDEAVEALELRRGQLSKKGAKKICEALVYCESMDVELRHKDDGFTLKDVIPGPGGENETVDRISVDEMRRVAWCAVMRMDAKKRIVFTCRAAGMSLAEVGDILGLTRERIRQIQVDVEERIRIYAKARRR